MLRALCEYYDCLRSRPDSGLVPEGYSKVTVNYNLVLCPDGRIKEILPYTEEVVVGKKVKTVGREEIFPFRNSVSGIAAETIDHREKYLFGLEWNKGTEAFGAGGSAAAAFEKNKEKNLAFLEPIHIPLAEAYKAFLLNWDPAAQTENPALLALGKDYAGAKFVITLEGAETQPLHALPEIRERWEANMNALPEENCVRGQCAISGKDSPLARTHDGIPGIRGGLATGVNLVCFNNSAFESYGRTQSYNSSVSVESMKHYTAALKYLAASPGHRQWLGDMTLLFWTNAKGDEEPYLSPVMYGLFPSAERAEDEELKTVFETIAKGKATEQAALDWSVDFYLLGIKPNSSRLSVKIFEKNTFGKIMQNVVSHCRDMRFSDTDRNLSLWEMDKALQSPHVNESADPALQAKLLLAILKGAPYPQMMLTTLVRRCRIDHDDASKKFYAVSTTRARMIRACLRRKNNFGEEEYTMLQEQSTDTAYHLGRLFAVLEKTQKDALGDVNATIKDKFFSSACATPYLVFPRLLKLAQPHLAKLDEGNRIFKEKQLQEIMGKLESFPRSLSIEQQGMFILGYYQQKQKFYEKTEKGE